MDKLRSSGSEALWSVHRLPDRSSLAPTLHEHGVAIVELSDAWIGHCEEMRVSCEEFFTLPSDLRRKVCVEVRPDTDGPLLDSAFVGKRTATGRDRLELKYSKKEGTLVATKGRNQYAAGDRGIATLNTLAPSALVKVTEAFYREARELSESILVDLFKAIGVDLQLTKLFESSDDLEASALRPMRYCASGNNSEERAVIAQEHTDIGLLTLMFCSAADGLEILTQDFEWIDLEAKAHLDGTKLCVFIIAGEQLAFLSAGHFPAVSHRVLAPSKSDGLRISFPFLLRAPPTAKLSPLSKFPLHMDTPSLSAREITSNNVIINEHSRVRLALARKFISRCRSENSEKWTAIGASSAAVVGDVAFGALHEHFPSDTLEIHVFCDHVPSSSDFEALWRLEAADRMVNIIQPSSCSSLSQVLSCSLATLRFGGFDILVTFIFTESVAELLKRTLQRADFGADWALTEGLFSLWTNAISIFGPHILTSITSVLKFYPTELIEFIVRSNSTFVPLSGAHQMLWTHHIDELFTHVFARARSSLLKIIFALNKTYYPWPRHLQSVYSVIFPLACRQLSPALLSKWMKLEEQFFISPMSALEKLYELADVIFAKVTTQYPQLIDDVPMKLASTSNGCFPLEKDTARARELGDSL